MLIIAWWGYIKKKKVRKTQKSKKKIVVRDVRKKMELTENLLEKMLKKE